MNEIRIVFKVPSNRGDLYDSWFDIYIDGQKQEQVKRFSIDLQKKLGDIDLSTDFSYTIEKYIDISETVDVYT